MELNEQTAIEWQKRTSGELFIAEQEHFRQSDFFLNHYSELKLEIELILNGNLVDQKFKIESKDKKGIKSYKPRLDATYLNKGIRTRFQQSKSNFKYEVSFNEGVFYDSLQTKGFDFAIFDEIYNLVNFRNLCFGRRSLQDGENRWTQEVSKRPLWRKLGEELELDKMQNGIDMEYKKQQPTILGEIQFGNWGLAYRDVLKVIQIEREEDVDLFIYITATGNLAKQISSGTVNFSKTKAIFEEFKNVLTMPIWLIGIDIN